MTRSKYRRAPVRFAAGLSLLCLLTGCSESSNAPATATEKKAFAGDPSKMPAEYKKLSEAAQQQGAKNAQRR